MMTRILQFLALLVLSVSAQSQTYYNAIATAYVTTTISQHVVFDANMQAGGTFTFSVLAHNGGGRAGQSDTANVKIEFYNSSGGLVSQVNTSHSANLPNPNAVCGNPCIDTSVPWTTLTVSKTLSAAEAGTVAYARVSMYGIDGSYWAGDYGPWYRAPTLQLNSGGNLLYNPEFGPYNNITAQGWTSNPGFGACQGAWGGSNACIVNSDGVPGSSTVGLVANQNGGGPSATGGTTSGTAGGYNNTMTVTNAGTGATAGGPPPPAPTVITGSSPTVYITNYYPTSNNSPVSEGASNAFDGNPNTKYLNFDKLNAGVTIKLNSGRVVTGFKLTTANDFSGRDPTSYKLYGSNNGSTWTLIQEGALSLSENRLTVSSEITVTNTNAYVYYYIFFPTTKAGTGCGLDCDSMQIAEITYIYDANNTTTSTATGSSVSNPGSLCCGGNASSFNANTSNSAKVLLFTNRTTADSQVYIEQIGIGNNIEVFQSGTRQNYAKYYGNGSNNDVTIIQTGNASTSVNYTDLSITGNSNNVNVTQQSSGGGKGAFVTISNNSNIVNVTQKDSGSHYLDLALSGGNKTVGVLQQGSASHMATINLSGNPTSLNLTQSGSTQNFYSITHNCATAGGCAPITVTQGN
jgi:hypothetical protein